MAHHGLRHLGFRPDFITRLLPSQNNTILTIVDRFSKAVHFLALPKLPTARETADQLVNHVFHLHGTPLDIVYHLVFTLRLTVRRSGPAMISVYICKNEVCLCSISVMWDHVFRVAWCVRSIA